MFSCCEDLWWWFHAWYAARRDNTAYTSALDELAENVKKPPVFANPAFDGWVEVDS